MDFPQSQEKRRCVRRYVTRANIFGVTSVAIAGCEKMCLKRENLRDKKPFCRRKKEESGANQIEAL